MSTPPPVPRAPFSRTALLALSCFAVLSVGTVLAVRPPAWLPEGLRAEPVPDPVLVFLVGDPGAVARMRDVIPDERIVVESPAALATVEQRIVSADTDAASELLNRAGWVEREIELFRVPPKDWLGSPRRRGAPDDADPERLARLRALARKPTLTLGEQRAVLQAMSEGLVF